MNQQVREFNGGRLRVVQRRGKEWPPQHPNITGTCPGAQSFEEPCYFAGEPFFILTKFIKSDLFCDYFLCAILNIKY